jgi:hypothetical protein
MADYIPHKDAEFDTWFSFMYQVSKVASLVGM